MHDLKGQIFVRTIPILFNVSLNPTAKFRIVFQSLTTCCLILPPRPSFQTLRHADSVMYTVLVNECSYHGNNPLNFSLISNVSQFCLANSLIWGEGRNVNCCEKRMLF